MSKNLSKNEIINLIKAEKSFLKENYGVLNIGLFGSYAKDQQTPDSDIDFLVEFEKPRFDWIAGLNIYMEKKFERKIEIIRKQTLNKSRFFERIEQEIIYALWNYFWYLSKSPSSTEKNNSKNAHIEFVSSSSIIIPAQSFQKPGIVADTQNIQYQKFTRELF